ncbi:MAG TPA: adenylate/guanylate cyclase domain-containing protein [Candidatus Limnocylindria bacterium]|nr:adenylate/guanylate cyclase domain-containing protein [Candidatus Limnocylindria bacterium]
MPEDFSRSEAAERAGISPELLRELIDRGIVATNPAGRLDAGEIRKAGLVEAMVEGGLPLDGLTTALRNGSLSLSFVDRPSYERFTGLSDQSFAQLARDTNVPLDLLTVIREATGGAQPMPEDLVREGELRIAQFLERALAEGFGADATERLLRAFGDSARRVSEIENAWWVSEVVAPRLAAGATPAEIGEYDGAGELTDLMEMAFMDMYRLHETHTWTANIIEEFESVLADAGIVNRLDRPPAVCFLDITGYTRLTSERGDAAAAQLATELGRLVQRTSVQHGGRPVKWLGDGVMAYFPNPGPGVEAALDMVDGVTDAGLPPAHVGLHAGPVIFQGGDYYGQTVNIASRIADYARPGEVLVSQAVVDASDSATVTFTDVGDVELKGVATAIHLHRALRT